MQSTAKSILDSPFVHQFDDAQNLIDIGRRVSIVFLEGILELACRVEVLIHFTHLGILVPLHRLPNNRLVVRDLMDHILRLHHVDERLRVHVRSNNFDSFLEDRMFFIVRHGSINTDHILHFRVVIVHEHAHLVNCWILTLLSRSLLIL